MSHVTSENPLWAPVSLPVKFCDTTTPWGVWEINEAVREKSLNFLPGTQLMFIKHLNMS